MATLTVYATAPGGAGSAQSVSDVSYSAARTGSGSVGGESNHKVGQQWSSPYWVCWETFTIFDTSSLTGGATVTAVVLSLDGLTNWSTTDFITGVAASAYDGGPVGSGDWVSGASIPTPELATWNSSAYSAGYNDFTSTGDFAAAINKTGNTSLILYSQEHRDNSAPTGDEYVLFTDADAAGTTTDPKLVITYTSGAQGTGALTVPFLSVAGTGEKVYTGTGAIQVPSPLSVAGSGLQSHIATAAFTLPIIQVAGVGNYVAPPVGTGVFTLPILNIAGIGNMIPEGVGAFTLPSPLLVAGSGLKVYTGISVITLPSPLSVSGSGIEAYIGTGNLIPPIIEFLATGKQLHIGTGAISIPLIVVTASGIQLISGTGAFTLPVVIMSTGTGLLVLPKKVLEYLLELPNYSKVIEVPSYETILQITTSSKVLTLPELAQTLPITQPSTTREL